MSVMVLANGPILWCLVVLGVIACLLFIKRLVDFRRAQIDYTDFMRGVKNVLDQGNDAEALAICDETPCPVARVTATAVRHSNGSARALREAVDAAGRSEVSRLERRLATLAIIAQSAPLLGLLGTIFGFMRIVMAADSGAIVARTELFNYAMQAMVVAAAGLVVAIPVQAMYCMLRVRLERVVADLEAAASDVLAVLTIRIQQRVEEKVRG